MNFKIVLGDMLMILFILLFPHFGHLPMFLYPFVVLGIVWGYLKYRQQNFATIGFRFSDLSVRSFFVGGICGLAYAAFVYWLLTPLMDQGGFKPANLNDFNFLRHHLNSYLMILVPACLLVIPYEEVMFRGFIFRRLNDLFKGLYYAYPLSAILISIIFALYHYQEGTGAVIQIFIFAILQMAMLKQAKGNLWYVIFFHVLYDIFMLTAIYRGDM
jgi:membrane protease YdiL (CAAX protease family)